MEKFFANEFAPYIKKPEDTKIKINKKDIVLNYAHSRDFKDTYKITFLITILPVLSNLNNPVERISASKIDMNSLKNAIMMNLKEYDRRYFEIYNFDTFKVEFVIKKSWMDDAVKGLTSRVHLSKFDRKFELKNQVPYIIRFNCSGDKGWNDFVVREFRKRLDDRDFSKHFSYLKNKNKFIKKIRVGFDNMFDWSYDDQWNVMTAKLKTFWIFSLIYAISGKFDKNDLIKPVSTHNKELYFQKIDKNKDPFKDIDWKTFLNKYKTK